MHSIAEPEASRDAVAELRELRKKFQAINAKLVALTRERAEERGINLDDTGLTQDELRRILTEGRDGEAQ